MQSQRRYFLNDFPPGAVINCGHYTVEKEEALRFAAAYDPQFFHLDEAKAKESVFGALAVSGWLTAALSMRLKALSPLGQIEGGLIGLGLESVRWPNALYPGECIHLSITVLSLRPSTSRPGYGVMRYRMDTRNQKNMVVMEAITTVLGRLTKES